MGYQFLADAVVILHLAFILFAILGGLLTLRWYWMPWIHLPALLWGTAVELFGWYCPLTPLENSLRYRSGGSGYSVGFIEHYLLPILYPTALTREIQIFLGVCLLMINLLVYWIVWYRRQIRSREVK